MELEYDIQQIQMLGQVFVKYGMEGLVERIISDYRNSQQYLDDFVQDLKDAGEQNRFIVAGQGAMKTLIYLPDDGEEIDIGDL